MIYIQVVWAVENQFRLCVQTWQHIPKKRHFIAFFVNSKSCNDWIMKLPIVLLYFCGLFGVGLMQEWNGLKSLLPVPIDPLKLNQVNQTYCTCGVFFSGQFKRGSSEPPKGHPVLMHEQDSMYPCTPIGTKQCSNKCLEVVSLIISSWLQNSTEL